MVEQAFKRAKKEDPEHLDPLKLGLKLGSAATLKGTIYSLTFGRRYSPVGSIICQLATSSDHSSSSRYETTKPIAIYQPFTHLQNYSLHNNQNDCFSLVNIRDG